mgnify:CR=1 FL=1
MGADGTGGGGSERFGACGLEEQEEERMDDAVLERGRRVGEAGCVSATGSGRGPRRPPPAAPNGVEEAAERAPRAVAGGGIRSNRW